MTDFDTIRYEAHDGVAAITLARPQKRNAVSLDMLRELGEATELP
jgi:enoyl-CoA hydratase/carnithine racemase